MNEPMTFFGRSHHSIAKLSEHVSFLIRKHSKSKSLKTCKRIHAKLVCSQSISEIYISNTIVNFYCRCGDFCNAEKIFDQMPLRNVVTWTSMISAYVHHGYLETALDFFTEMLRANERPNQFTVSITLRACTILGFFYLGLQIHGLVLRMGLESDEFAGSSLVDMYFKSGNKIKDAYLVFNGLFRRDSVTWNVIISGFSQVGDAVEVLKLFWCMWVVDGVKPSNFTFTSLIKSCSLLTEVEQIHALALKFGAEVDVVVATALVDMYGKCGNIDTCWRILDWMPNKDSFFWSSVISCYVRSGRREEAIDLFRDMCRQGMRPDQHVLSGTLKACSDIGDLKTGIQVHTQMIKCGYKNDQFVASVLLTVYTNCNKIHEAEKLFVRIDARDIVLWNSMILGYAQMEEGSASSCIRIFREFCRITLFNPDGATFVCLLKSVKSDLDVLVGIQIHAMIIKSSQQLQTFIGNAVVNMYSKCGLINDAFKAFSDTSQKDDVSWSSIIGSCQQNGLNFEALRLCKEMLAHRICLTSFSLPLCIAACSGLATMDIGKQFHCFAIKFGFSKDAFVGSSIIDMYAKCGNMEDSKRAFDEQEEPNEVTINALISGLGQHGRALEAIEVFKEMEIRSIIPNKVTLLSILSACSHAGFLEESLYFFYLMNHKYRIKPESEHFSCLIDVFGRAGKLDEAYEIIQNNGSVSGWRTLLSACRNYGDRKIAEKSARRIMELDPYDHASYVLLSNIYSREGKWDDVLELRQKMVNNRVKKDRGSSWLIFRERVHEFLVGDFSHHETDNILSQVQSLDQHINNIGSWHALTDCYAL